MAFRLGVLLLNDQELSQTTRLVKDLGKKRSRNLYQDWMKLWLKLLQKNLNTQIFCFHNKNKQKPKIRDQFGHDLFYIPRAEINDFNSLAEIFEFLCSNGQSGFLKNTRSILFDKNYLLRARKELKAADMVIGPTDRNSFYLLGFRRFYKEFFKALADLGKFDLENIVEAARTKGIRIEFLPTLKEITKKQELSLLQKWVAGLQYENIVDPDLDQLIKTLSELN